MMNPSEFPPEEVVENKTEKETLGLIVPQAEAEIMMYENEYENNPEHIGKLREIFQILTEQGIQNTQIFHSDEVNASIPWTVIRLPELAKALYEKHASIPVQTETTNSQDKNTEHTFAERREYIFATSISVQGADEFGWVEESMHQMIRHLPRAIEDLKNGREPENFETYMMGMPTNTLGEISEEFSNNLKKDPYEYMGRLYADFISKQATQIEGKKAIELYGISMGGGFAAKTGEKLIQSGAGTQNFGQEGIENTAPFLQIKSMVPVSMGHTEKKNWQIMPGFVAESVVALTSPGIRKIGKDLLGFQKKVNEQLVERGINENMSDEQKKLKKDSLSSIITGLGKKLEIDPSVKLTKVIGLQDLTMYTPSFNREAQKHREENLEENEGEATLGTQIVSRKEENQRTFGINVHHNLPFFREAEYKRMKKAAEAMMKIS